MPPKKKEAPADQIPLQIAVPPEIYAQIEQAANNWGYSIQEWLDEAIRNQL